MELSIKYSITKIVHSSSPGKWSHPFYAFLSPLLYSSICLYCFMCIKLSFLLIAYIFQLELIYDCLLSSSCLSLFAWFLSCRRPFSEWSFCKAATSTHRYLLQGRKVNNFSFLRGNLILGQKINCNISSLKMLH